MINRQLKLFIDLTALTRTITGIENYTLNICYEIVKRCPSNIKCYLLFRNLVHTSFLEFQEFHESIISPFKSQMLTEQLFIPYYLSHNRFDIVFFPCFPPGFFVKRDYLIICYDATMWKYKKTLSLKNKLYFRPLSERALKYSRCIFTISDSSQKDIEECFPITKGKIFNISAALPASFVNKENVNFQYVADKYSLQNRYFISVGSIEPRKNLKFLIETIAPILKDQDMKLVLVGRKAWGSKKLANKISELDISLHLVQTGYVSPQELQILYKNAECFIFPSLYEGFGFPILEAFSCECPVITSNVSSMPYVAGNAAILIDPNDGQMLKAAIYSILFSKEKKTVLIQKGKEQLKNFSWERCAQEFFKEINKL